MMMIYGMFVFELRTLPHQQLQQNKSWRHVKNERVNRSASWQYIGAGDERIVLSGVLYPEITGGEVSLSLLTTQAYTGRPWPLIDGVGQIYGMYVLTETNTTRSEFDRYGNTGITIIGIGDVVLCGSGVGSGNHTHGVHS